jgi:hypothetical protein
MYILKQCRFRLLEYKNGLNEKNKFAYQKIHAQKYAESADEAIF